MKTNTIITIGRQYGSAGRQIGRVLAEELGIKCYDKELLERAAKESGLCEELFENHDEKPTNSFLYSLVMDTYSFGYTSSAFSAFSRSFSSSFIFDARTGCYSCRHKECCHHFLRIVSCIFRHFRSCTHKSHITFQNIKQLR
mgnify:CR=1 FL=1